MEKVPPHDQTVCTPVGHFLNKELMWEGPAHCRLCPLWFYSHGFYRIADGKSHDEQVSMQHPQWPPASMFLPCLSFCPGFLH